MVFVVLFVLLLVGASKLFFFFFSSRRRHTRLQGDWSSDVLFRSAWSCTWRVPGTRASSLAPPRRTRLPSEKVSSTRASAVEIGRAACRERVEISVVAGSLKKKKKTWRGEARMRKKMLAATIKT